MGIPKTCCLNPNLIAHCAGNLEELFDGTILVMLAILVRGRTWPSWPSCPTCSPTSFPLEAKIARLLAILLPPPCPACPTCSPTSLPVGGQGCKIAWQSCSPPCNLGLKGKLVSETTIARSLGNLLKLVVLLSRHCHSSLESRYGHASAGLPGNLISLKKPEICSVLRVKCGCLVGFPLALDASMAVEVDMPCCCASLGHPSEQAASYRGNGRFS